METKPVQLEENIKLEENYIYPVRIKEGSNSYIISLVDFPDGYASEAQAESETIKKAQELLALAIIDFVTQGKELPQPSKNVNDAIYVHIWMPYHKKRVNEVYVKKTLTIPQRLNALARKNNVNFSAALVRGIKEELGIK